MMKRHRPAPTVTAAELPSLSGMQSVVAVAATGSFSAAAKQRGTSTVAISRAVSAIEAEMGVQLFQRTTRSVQLTAIGRAFAQRCEVGLRELRMAHALARASGSVLTGTVRITTVSALGDGYLPGLIAEFQAAHPGFAVELALDDSVNNMVDEQYDFGFRIASSLDGAQVAIALAAVQFVCCASPEYLATSAPAETAEALYDHPWIRVRLSNRAALMPVFVKGVPISGAESRFRNLFVVNEFRAALEAAIRGTGLFCAPLPLVLPALRAGRLRAVLPQLSMAPMTLYLRYPTRKHVPQSVRALMTFLRGRIQADPIWQASPAQLLSAIR